MFGVLRLFLELLAAIAGLRVGLVALCRLAPALDLLGDRLFGGWVGQAGDPDETLAQLIRQSMTERYKIEF